MRLTKELLARMIDSSIVRPSATYSDVKKCCEEAKVYGFYSVSVNSTFVSYAKNLLKGSEVRVVGNIGFPFGVQPTEAKLVEAEKVINDGADEIDIVMNIGRFKSRDYDFVRDELTQLINAAREQGEKLGKKINTKVIIEIGWLTDDEIVKASEIASKAGADFIKTATGFGPRGPTVKDVELIKKGITGGAAIKVSQGIRTFDQALSFIRAGARRIGTSTPVRILKGFPSSKYVEI